METKLDFHNAYTKKDFIKFKQCVNCGSNTVQDTVFSTETIWYDCVGCHTSVRGLLNKNKERDITVQVGTKTADNFLNPPFFVINKNGIHLIFDLQFKRTISDNPYAYSIKELQEKLQEYMLLL